MKSILTLSASILTLLFTGCHKESTDSGTQHLSHSQMHLLPCFGFHPDSVILENDAYRVDGDMVVDADFFNIPDMSALHNDLDINANYDTQLESRGLATAGYETKKVNLTTVKQLKYYIDPLLKSSIANNNWERPIREATQHYNNVDNCSVYFSETYNISQANLIFILYTSGNTLIPINWNHPSSYSGMACFPKNGQCGKYITLRPRSYGLDNKRRVAIHEIGHTLGFRHTCVSGEPSSTQDNCGSWAGLFEIKGTPTSDCNSVMKTFSTVPTTNLWLSDGDKTSLKYLYPENYNPPVITSIQKYQQLGSWYIKVKLSKTPFPNVPYRVQLSRYLMNGSHVDSKSFYSPQNNSNEFHMPVSSGTFQFKLWYRNHGDYFVGSNLVSITI